MQATLFEQGVSLMLVGMGTVFVFLSVLVAAMSIMSGVIRRFTPVADEGTSEEEVAAIMAAVARHRQKNS